MHPGRLSRLGHGPPHQVVGSQWGQIQSISPSFPHLMACGQTKTPGIVWNNGDMWGTRLKSWNSFHSWHPGRVSGRGTMQRGGLEPGAASGSSGAGACARLLGKLCRASSRGDWWARSLWRCDEDVRCTKMQEDVGRCRKMQEDVGRCRKMQEDVGRCREM